MFTSVWIFEIVILGAVLQGHSELASNIKSLAYKPNACAEFGLTDARFAPHDVVDSLWRIFYFWAEGMEISTILFALPSTKEVNDFKSVVEDVVPDVHIEWQNASLFMKPRLGVRILLVRTAHDGIFLAVAKIEETNEDDSFKEPRIDITTVQMKTAYRFMAIMNCNYHTAFALARISEMPPTEYECKAEASKLGLDAKKGKSYLSLQKHYIKDEL